MIKKPEEAERFLIDLASKALPYAAIERKELLDWMRNHQDIKRLEPWDYRYVAEKVRGEKIGYFEAEASDYFSVIGCIERSVSFLSKVINCECKRVKDAETVENLMVFEFRRKKELLGHISISPFATEAGQEGYGFEWDMRAPMKGVNQSACAMIFLQLGRHAKMAHSEVVVLFHELGHAFYTLLSKPKSFHHRAINVEWDTIETHSQFFENLAWESSALRFIGRKKGNVMPKKMIDGLVKGRHFHNGSALLSSITEALCDLRLHSQFDPSGALQSWEVLRIARNEVGLDSAKSYNRQANQLVYLSASEYAAAGYSYLWSECLAANMTDQWRQDSKGKVIHAKAAARFEKLTIQAGARIPAAKQFEAYTGQRANLDVFLKWKKLTNE